MQCVLRAKSTDFHSLCCTATCFWPNALPSASVRQCHPTVCRESLDETTWCGGAAAAGVSRVVAARRAGVCTQAMPSQARRVLSCRDARQAKPSQAKPSRSVGTPHIRRPALGSIAYVLLCAVTACLLDWPFVCLFVCLFVPVQRRLPKRRQHFRSLELLRVPLSLRACHGMPRPLSRRRRNERPAVGSTRGCDLSPNARRYTCVKLAAGIAETDQPHALQCAACAGGGERERNGPELRRDPMRTAMRRSVRECASEQ